MRQKIIQPVIVAVIRRDNKYLVTLRTDFDREKEAEGIYHAWQLPGGGLEFGEDAEECLRRECREELGADIEIITLIPKLYHDVRKGFWHGLIISFLCRIEDNVQIKLNEEASEYAWVTVDEIKKRKTLRFVAEVIEMAEKIK